MLKLALRRIAVLIPTLLIIVTLAFAIIRLAPGGPFEEEQGASPAVRANSIRECAAEGILILGPATPWLSHNLIEKTKGEAIAARDGAKPALLENVVTAPEKQERRTR